MMVSEGVLVNDRSENEVLVPTTVRLRQGQIHWIRRRAVEDAERRGVGRIDLSRTFRAIVDRAIEEAVRGCSRD